MSFIRQSIDREQIFDVTFKPLPIEKSCVRPCPTIELCEVGDQLTITWSATRSFVVYLSIAPRLFITVFQLKSLLVLVHE